MTLSVLALKFFFLVCSFALFLCVALFCFVVVLFFFALTRIKPFGYKSGDSTGNEQNKKILPG